MASKNTSETTGRHARDVAPTAETPASTAVEPGGEELPRHGFFTRLYTGTGAFDVIGRRKIWFTVSAIIVVIAISSIAIRGFTFGIDFKGGTTVSFPRGDATVQQVTDVYHRTLGHDPESVVMVGNGNSATVQIRSETLTNDQTARLRDALFGAFQPKGTDGKPSARSISDSAVSSTWGSQITRKAVIALVVFLVLVGLYIMVRYERYMAMSALGALCFDLLTTAGVYSLVGFEVSPATVIGLLTILGFSLYDTVIVFDKVEENTHGFQHTTRRTFAEQANLAINQTFMRSINTSLISVVPVVSLMIVAVWLLGVGTLKDLALVMLVGILVGTYSSIFFATPLLVTLRERTDLVRGHSRRVMRRRKPESASTPADDATNDEDDEPVEPLAALAGKRVGRSAAQPGAKPAPGARPARPTKSTGRPSGKRSSPRR
ncbi:MAG: protein translocase subunit SecF [Mycobacteriaceae bacterium]|nr:protein translocase subunit SecF [Mycobacteriaceae bacterium]MBV9641874.1 protein translocase subunit SecF [Mycobacteriaceae bacterium]